MFVLRTNLPTAECGFLSRDVPSDFLCILLSHLSAQIRRKLRIFLCSTNALSDISISLFRETEKTNKPNLLSKSATPTTETSQELIQLRNAHVLAKPPKHLFLFRVSLQHFLCIPQLSCSIPLFQTFYIGILIPIQNARLIFQRCAPSFHILQSSC